MPKEGPFLLSEEEKLLVTGLREKKFFEYFAYDAAKAQWYARDVYIEHLDSQRERKREEEAAWEARKGKEEVRFAGGRFR